MSLFLKKLENQNNKITLKLKKVIFCQTIRTPLIVFLDSHVEVTEEWLEPLIGPIMKGKFIFINLHSRENNKVILYTI